MGSHRWRKGGGVAVGGWAGGLAAGWVIRSREGRRRYVESPSMARRMPEGAPEVVVLATRNSKARPTIVRRFRKSRRVVSPPPSLATSSTATRPSSSWAPSPGTALSQTSSSSDTRRSISKSDSREPLAWRITFGKSCTTPVSSIAVTTSRVLALS